MMMATTLRPERQLSRLREAIRVIDPEVVLVDGFDGAFIGLSSRAGQSFAVATYDRGLCLRILMDRGLDLDEAIEFFEFNVFLF